MNELNQLKKRRRGRVLRWTLVILVVLAAVAAGGLIALNHYLNASGARERIEAAAGSLMGSEVRIGDLTVSLWRGFSLRDVTVASVLPGLDSPLTIPEISIKYRVADLIRRRLTINEIVIRNPVLILNRNEHDAPPAAGAGADRRPFRRGSGRIALSASASRASMSGSSSWNLAVDSLRLVNLSVEMNLGPPLEPVRLEGIDLDARLDEIFNALEAKGALKLGRASAKGASFLQDLCLDFELKGNRLDISSIRAAVLEGELKGKITAVSADPGETGAVPWSVDADLALAGIRPAAFFREGLEMDLLAGGELAAALKARGELPRPEARLDVTFFGLKLTSGLEVEKGEIEIRHPGGETRVDNILPRLEGRLSVRRLLVENLGAFEDIHVPLDLRDNIFQSRGLKATAGGGNIIGDIRADLTDPARIPYQGELRFADVDLALLQATLEEPPEIQLTGRANGRAVFSGLAGPIENLKSEGRAELKKGSITGHPTQKMVAALTGIRRLEQIDLDPAELKFRVADGVLEVREGVVYSDQVRIDTSGRIRLDPSRDLDFKVRLNFRQQLVEEISPRELRLALKPAFPGDEFRGIEFRLWGSPENIRSDYQEVFLRSMATGILRRESPGRDGDESGPPDSERELIERKLDTLFKIFR